MPSEKHLVYYNLLEWLQQKGCALCTAESLAAARHLEMILQEGVNHPYLRGQLLQSRGYCRRHAGYWLAAGHPVDRALLYLDQVKGFADFLNAGRPVRFAHQAKNIAQAWQEHSLCPACAAEREAAERHLRALFEYWAQPELQSALQAGPAFCPAHFFQALRQAPDPTLRAALLDWEHAKLRSLQQDLEELLRKLGSQAKAAEFGPESDAWLRAIHQMAGIPCAAPAAPPAKPAKRVKKTGIKTIHQFQPGPKPQ